MNLRKITYAFTRLTVFLVFTVNELILKCDSESVYDRF